MSSEHGDVNKFFRPKGPLEKIFWPQCDDVCWILIEDVYCEIDAPSADNTGRFYRLIKKIIENIEIYFNKDQLLYCSLLSQFIIFY